MHECSESIRYTLVLNDSGGNIGENGLGISLALRQMSADTKDLAALSDVELQIIIRALVGDLSQALTLR